MFYIFSWKNYNATSVLQWTVGSTICNIRTPSGLCGSLQKVCLGSYWSGWIVGLDGRQHSQTSWECTGKVRNLQERWSPDVIASSVVCLCRLCGSVRVMYSRFRCSEDCGSDQTEKHVTRWRRTSGHFLIFCVLRHTKSFSGILNSMVELQQSLFHTPDMQNITLSRVISTCAMNSSRTYQQNNIFEWEKQMICVLEMGLQQVYSFFHSHLSLLSGKWCTVDGQPNCCWNVCTSFTRSCTSFLSVTTVRDTWNSDFVCRAFDWIASMHFAQNPWAVEANR